MRCLCVGGSFDPVHFGHLRCATAAAEQLGLETVLLIPASVSPHKMGTSRHAAKPHDRLAMCRLAAEEMNQQTACDGSVRFQIDDLELQRPPPSYTIDTVRALRSRGWDTVHWMIGADQLAALPNWHEPQALLTEANLVVLRRPGFQINWDALPPSYQMLKANLVDAPLIDISSTMIRTKVNAGEPITGLVPASVERYILSNQLYR
jgi:nicotinate-nucleotide adenylyltransferase